MNFLRKLMVISLVLIVLPVAGQQEDRQESEALQLPDYSNYEIEREERFDTPEEKARKAERAPPAIVPNGWLYDYDYRIGLFDYLRKKVEGASKSNKSTYVYLYADWQETCVAFRKTAGRKDYKELFQNNEIIMLDYLYFKRRYGTQFKKFPVFIKVHKDGMLGPESNYPISSANEHPRRAYHKLKKFLQSNDDAH